MIVDHPALGDFLELARNQVDPDIAACYRHIGVRGFGRGIFEYPDVSGAELPKLRFFELSPNRLVISNIKGWEGAVAVTAGDENGRIASNRFLQFRAIGDVNLSFLRHWFLSDSGLELLGRVSPGTADRNRTLSVKGFLNERVPLPPIEEQRRIAAHLDSFGPFATSSGTTDSVMQTLVDYDWGGDRVPLSALVTPVSRPATVEEDETYNMLGVRWYGAGLFRRETRSGRELSARTVYAVHEGDLVYNRLFAWKQSFALADKTLGYVSNEFPTFRCLPSVRPRFLLGVLLGSRFTAAVNDASTGSTPTSRNRLKEEAFLSLDIAVPDLAVQRKVESLFAVASRIEALAARRSALAAALLPAARNEIFSAMR